MWNEIAAWQERLYHRPDLSAKSIALYTQDARRFTTWLLSEHPGVSLEPDTRRRGGRTLRASKRCTPLLLQLLKPVRSRSRWKRPRWRLIRTLLRRLLA